MKSNNISVIIVLLSLMLSVNISAKEKKTKTVEFEVAGVCDMCEKRIENAALIKGVKLAEWDKKTKKIKVVYVTKKTDLLSIQKSIAGAGYDTGKIKAKDKDYKSLPACCAYRDGVSTH